MGIERIAVIGAGQMGSGIAQVAASNAGAQVWIYDASEAAVIKAKERIGSSLKKLEEKGKLATGASAKAMENLRVATRLEQLADCQLIIEAIVEQEAIKRDLFTKLDAIVKPEAIFASNTSSIPITVLGKATRRSDRFIGMHFMNPVPIMSLVEIIRSPLTSDATYQTIQDLAKAMGKEVVTSKDFAGFIVNRILMPMINEAFFALQEGLATAEDIDKAMKLGTNQPMGPLTLGDFIGLDTVLFILEVLHRDFGDPKFRPCPLLRQYVNAGLYGKKSGQGVFVYGN